MPLPAIAAGAARGLAAVGRGAAKGARGLGKRATKRAIRRPASGAPAEETEEGEEAPKKSKSSILLSPEGVLMMFVGGLLDVLSIIGAILILAFGVGLIFAKIVYIVGLVIVGSWAFFRSGTVITGKKGAGLGKKGGKALMSFLKRQWPKLAGKAVPAIGDSLPLWSWTVYSELTSE